jgi:hypothetical protein
MKLQLKPSVLNIEEKNDGYGKHDLTVIDESREISIETRPIEAKKRFQN